MKSYWIAAWTAAAILLAAFADVRGAQAGPPANSFTRLRLTFESDGSVTILFLIAALPEKASDIESAMSQALGLKLRDADCDLDIGRHVSTFYAKTAVGFTHDALTVHGQISLAPIDRLLTGLRVPSLAMACTHPRCAFTRFSTGRVVSEPRSPVVEYAYNVPLGGKPLIPIEFHFGYRKSDVARIAGPLLVFLIVPAGLALAWRRLSVRHEGVPQSIAPFRNFLSREARFAIIAAAAVWLTWGVALVLLGADFLAWFVTGIVSELGQILVIAVMVWLPWAVFGGMTTWVLKVVPQYEQAQSASSSSIRSLLFRASAHLIVPAVLAATGIMAIRQLKSLSALEWLSASILTAAAGLGAFLWSHAGELDRDTTSDSRHREGAWWKDLQRQAVLRSCYAQLGAAVLLPALAVTLLRQARLDDTIRYAALVGVLVFSICLLEAFSRFLSARGLRRLQMRAPTRRLGPIFAVGALLLIAWGVAVLERFPFDLTNGDEGWAMLLMTGGVALFHHAPTWRSKNQRRAKG
jgi:hypothetical protein